MVDYQTMMAEALTAGFDRAAELLVADLRFLPDVRDMCQMNRCGAYGKNWACPPGCGSLAECEARVRRYRKGILVQTIGQLEDSFDFEGMQAAAEKFQKTFVDFHQTLKVQYPDLLGMGAGGCRICGTCTYPDAPCRFPERAMPSMEASGLMVKDVCEACGVSYINGINTVTYVGCYLLERA